MKSNLSLRGFTDLDTKDKSFLFETETITTVDRTAERYPRERFELEQVIDYISTLSDDWNGYGAKKASEASLTAARSFLARLPLNKICPSTVSLDGEGGIIFAWRLKKERLLLTIEGHLLHLSHETENKRIEYLSDVIFDFSIIPGDVLQKIPLRSK